MSFTFRNLFSEEDGTPGAEPPGDSASASGRNAAEGVPGERTPEGENPVDSAPSAQAASAQAFQVNELLPFIPPAISAESGIPMEKEVLIPMPADGSGDVSLSTIYRIVPELFAAEITPLNDSKVTLPTKLGGMMGESAQGGGSPGQTVSTQKLTGGGTDNPFWSPGVDETSVAAKAAAPSGKPPVSQEVGGQGETKSPFGAPEPSPENPFAEFEDIMPGGQEVEVSIPTGFESPESKAREEASGEPVDGGGESPPDAQPGFGTGANPFADLNSPGSPPPSAPQPEQVAPAGLNPFDSDAGFSTLFSKEADKDSDIPFPDSGSKESKREDDGDSWGAMFDADLAPGSGEEDAEKPKSEAVSNSPAPGPLPSGFNQGFGDMINQSSVAAESFAPKEEAPAAAESKEDLPSGFQSVEGFSPPESSAPFEEGEKEKPAPEEPEATEVERIETAPEPTMEEESPSSDFSAFPDFAPIGDPAGSEAKRDVWSDGGDHTPEPNFQLDDLGIAVPESGVEPTVEEPVPFGDDDSAESEEPEIRVETVAPTAGPAESMQVDGDISLRDLEFRAIFSTDESFTLAALARKIVGLQGIEGCALATRSKLVQASKTEQSSLGSEAREMIGTIRNLAKLTGLPEARSFTLHTDRGTVSLFLEGECCVTVNHSSAGFSPGVKEKLILIARNIHKLKE
ncbi:MAG: hypothetical protein MI807_17660 [Verrucomicrobiales bacterium]|nr:hypothetical protein [Verrucomicrobiales bacterium]